MSEMAHEELKLRFNEALEVVDRLTRELEDMTEQRDIFKRYMIEERNAFRSSSAAKINLRDQFAMAVMTGILSSAIHFQDRTESAMDCLPSACFKMADKMMIERAKEQ